MVYGEDLMYWSFNCLSMDGRDLRRRILSIKIIILIIFMPSVSLLAARFISADVKNFKLIYCIYSISTLIRDLVFPALLIRDVC